MKTMKKFFIGIIVILLLLVFIKPAFADVAPPEKPPGSSIIPGQDTKVRMVAENVLMIVKATSTGTYVLDVTADFAMKNLGDTGEQIQVRFPMENINGMGDGFGNHVLIKNFQVSVNNKIEKAEVITEPYQYESINIAWSVFEVSFQPGKEVLIHLSYVTELQSISWPEIEYILGTGSGWYDTIGTATIAVRLPYAVSNVNVDLSYSSPNNVIIGNEIRWHWKNYEPKIDEVIRVYILQPSLWKKILFLEGQTGENSAAVSSFIALSQAYREAGTEKHGCVFRHDIAELAEMAVEQSLAFHTEDISLHLELAEIYLWRISCYVENIDDPSIQNLEEELNIIQALDPTNARSVEIKDILAQIITSVKNRTPIFTATIESTLMFEPSKIIPTPILEATRTITPTIQATRTPTVKFITTELTPGVTPTTAPAAKDNQNTGFQIFGGAFLFVLGFVLGSIFIKIRQR